MAEPAFNCEELNDSIVIHAPSARLTMRRVDDCWSHHLELETPNRHEPRLLIAVDGLAGDQHDPSRIGNPVFQELQRHELASDARRGQCLLLTGHLFQHHFSAAVSVLPDPAHAGWVVLDVDLADRCRAQVFALAATYQVKLGGADLVDSRETAIVWDLGQSDRLELRCDPACRLAMAEAGRTATRVQIVAGLEPQAFTHRLRYQWRWRLGS